MQTSEQIRFRYINLPLTTEQRNTIIGPRLYTNILESKAEAIILGDTPRAFDCRPKDTIEIQVYSPFAHTRDMIIFYDIYVFFVSDLLHVSTQLDGLGTYVGEYHQWSIS